MFNRASKKLVFSIIGLIRNYELIIALFLYGLSAIIYIFALTKGDLNVLYPISALTYVWSTILAKFMLKEKINIYKWSGIALIIIGAAFIVQ